MVSMIDDSTVGMLSLALDAATMRQQAIAQNIANANTPGYQRLAVSFEARLAEARQSAGDGRAPSLGELAHYRPQFITAPGSAAGDPVQLDIEVAGLSENTLQHQALLKALNRHMDLLSVAINEGKR